MGSSLDLLDLLYLVVVEPLLPLLAGAGLFMLTRSHLIGAGLSALGFGAWGALYFSRLSLDGPLSGALYGLGADGVTSGLVALAGSGYVRLIGAEARRLGTERTAVRGGSSRTVLRDETGDAGDGRVRAQRQEDAAGGVF